VGLARELILQTAQRRDQRTAQRIAPTAHPRQADLAVAGRASHVGGGGDGGGGSSSSGGDGGGGGGTGDGGKDGSGPGYSDDGGGGVGVGASVARWRLVVVDDDTWYPPRVIEALLRWSMRLPRAAIGQHGWVPSPRLVYNGATSQVIFFFFFFFK